MNVFKKAITNSLSTNATTNDKKIIILNKFYANCSGMETVM